MRVAVVDIGTNSTRLLVAEAEFCVLDPAFNALWAWSELALADLARRLDEDNNLGCPLS